MATLFILSFKSVEAAIESKQWNCFQDSRENFKYIYQDLVQMWNTFQTLRGPIHRLLLDYLVWVTFFINLHIFSISYKLYCSEINWGREGKVLTGGITVRIFNLLSLSWQAVWGRCHAWQFHSYVVPHWVPLSW